MKRMATRTLDVWIMDSDAVYKDVPFTVVADWIQQGRLLASDSARLAGNKSWHPLEAIPAFTPYFPQPEAAAAEDSAEAHEPVDLGISWKSAPDEEEEDVDMIPLIDISLVLLIFFMMTALVQPSLFSPIKTPPAEFQVASLGENQYWIGIDNKNANRDVVKDAQGKAIPWYSLGRDQEEIVSPRQELSEVLQTLQDRFGKTSGEVRLRVRAAGALPTPLILETPSKIHELEDRLNKGRESAARIRFVVQAEVSAPGK